MAIHLVVSIVHSYHSYLSNIVPRPVLQPYCLDIIALPAMIIPVNTDPTRATCKECLRRYARGQKPILWEQRAKDLVFPSGIPVKKKEKRFRRGGKIIRLDTSRWKTRK